MGKRVAELAGQICRYARVMKYVLYDVSAGLTETLPDRSPQRHRTSLKDPARIDTLLRAIEDYQGDVSTRYALRILSYFSCALRRYAGRSGKKLTSTRACGVFRQGI